MNEQNVKKIFMGLPGGIGDLILVSPIIKEIKKKFPESKITFGVGNAPFRSVVETNPYVDHIFSPFSFESDPLKLKQQKRELASQYDKIILFHIPKDPIKLRRKLRQWLEKKGFYWDKRHIIDHYIDLAKVSIPERKTEFYFTGKDQNEADRFLAKNQISESDFVIVIAHTVGHSEFLRAWPLDHFEKLIQKISDSYDCKIILTGGKDDPMLANETAIDMRGFPIRPTACVIKRADLFVGTDSGLTQVASCFEGQIVSINVGHPIFYSGSLSSSVCYVNKPSSQKSKVPSVDQVYAVINQYLPKIHSPKN
jgi:ADP-heptose:LPS heptosyltransferase